jgi:hypothetical protein
MILINFGIQDGERDYREWSYYETFSKADYDKGKVNDFIVLNEVYGVEEDDLEDNNAYWDNNRLIWVESVQDIDQATLDILKRYV